MDFTPQSFGVDHTVLQPGLYLSRVKYIFPLGFVKVWDIRAIAPAGNTEAWPHDVEKRSTFQAISSAAMHSIEHLMAYKLRAILKGHYVSFNPMGCHTGFYLETSWMVSEKDVRAALTYAIDSTLPICCSNEIPALSYERCGNPNLFCVKETNTVLNNIKEALTHTDRKYTMIPEND